MDIDFGNVYLASRYSRADEMRGVRDILAQLAPGTHVTSRWIDHHGGKYPGSFTVDQLNDDPAYCSGIALADVQDVHAATTMISFTGQGGKGGRHVEFGLAVALEMRLIVVGPREHVFHTLAEVEHFVDWPAFARAISSAHLDARAREGATHVEPLGIDRAMSESHAVVTDEKAGA